MVVREYWRGYVVGATGVAEEHVASRDGLRYWLALHLEYGAVCGFVSRSGLVSGEPTSWHCVLKFVRHPETGEVSWEWRN